MFGTVEYTSRVVRGADNVYRWRAKLPREEQASVVRLVLCIMGGFCLLMIALTLLIGPNMLLPVLLACAGVMAVAGLSSLLFRPRDGVTQPYELTAEHVRYVGCGRTDSRLDFKNVRRVRVDAARDLLRIRGLLTAMPVYVSHEDFLFVRNYILQRVPHNARVDGL